LISPEGAATRASSLAISRGKYSFTVVRRPPRCRF
jgi:hypothetical protein